MLFICISWLCLLRAISSYWGVCLHPLVLRLERHLRLVLYEFPKIPFLVGPLPNIPKLWGTRTCQLRCWRTVDLFRCLLFILYYRQSCVPYALLYSRDHDDDNKKMDKRSYLLSLGTSYCNNSLKNLLSILTYFSTLGGLLHFLGVVLVYHLLYVLFAGCVVHLEEDSPKVRSFYIPGFLREVLVT